VVSGGSTAQTFTLTTSFSDYIISGSTDVQVSFLNDASGRDVQVDYVIIDGITLQAEDQAINTGVWQNESCGGSYSEWLQCNGYIYFSGTSTQKIANAKDVIAVQDVEALNNLSVYPNPFSELTTISFDLSVGQEVSINLYDITGRLVDAVHTETYINGKHEVEYNNASLKTGMYLLRVKTGSTVKSLQLLVD